MNISKVYEAQEAIAVSEFDDIVSDTTIMRRLGGEALKLRLHLIDDSFLEVNLSTTGRYSYHWERRIMGRTDVYRFDDAPHAVWNKVATFPAHFHNGSNEHVEASDISRDPAQAIRQVLTFVRRKLREEQQKQVQSGE